jgi:hypothetical protein
MPRGNGQERVTNDLGLYAYLLMHGLKKVRVSGGPKRRGYRLVYLDPLNQTDELRNKYLGSRARAHDGLVRDLRREIHESERHHRQQQQTSCKGG